MAFQYRAVRSYFMPLTSIHNPLLQEIRKVVRSGQPTNDGLVVAEGPHLLAEAMRGAWQIERVLTTAEGRGRYSNLLRDADCEIIELGDRAFASIATTETPQPVIALVRPSHWNWQDLLGDSPMLIVLDGIQDPGNAGTVVRSAEAFRASGIVFLKSCVRVANGKFLRAAAGSIFRLPFLEGIAASELIHSLQLHDLTLYALAVRGKIDVRHADLRKPCALAVGSEGAGVSSEILSHAETLRIPISNVESLNAAIACSIALFSAQQQRESQ